MYKIIIYLLAQSGEQEIAYLIWAQHESMQKNTLVT